MPEPTNNCYVVKGLNAAVLALLVAGKPSAAEEATGNAQLEEVIVTAEKRENTEQKTAISMTVLGSDTLKQNNIGNLADLTAIAPSVSFAINQAAAIVTVRGVSSRDTNQLGDPAVTISIDGFNLQRAIGLNAGMFDLERVEALRGPQGTLLGRNATGGALNIVTVKPKDSFGASASMEFGNYDTFNTQGSLNAPVNDVLKVRAAFQTRDHDGYRDNAPAVDGDDEHSKAARLHVQLDPNDAWSLLLTGEHTEDESVGPVVQPVAWVRLPNGAVDVGRQDIPGDGKRWPVPPGGRYRLTTDSLRWNTTYDFDFAQLTYLGGYREVSYDRLNTLGGAYGSVRQNLSFNQRERPKSWNHELRLNSDDDGRLMWVAGLYYFQEKNFSLTRFQDYPGSDTLYGEPVDLQVFLKPAIDVESSAAFGQISYRLTDALTVEAGARYSTDDKSSIGYNDATNVAVYLQTGAVSYTSNVLEQESSSNKTTYHAALNWQATDSNLLYAKFDTGYKAGGFTDPSVYGPESITAYEIGAKNRFLDNRLQLNLSAFFYEYVDQQVQQQMILASGGIGTGTVNAGESELYGAEAESIVLVTPADRVNFYVAYLNAEFTDFLTGVGGTNVQLAGNKLPQAPSWVANLGYQHEWDFFGGTLTGRVQTHYESESHFTYLNFGADLQPAYHRTDAYLTYTPEHARWSIEGYVRNIEDETILTQAQDPTATAYAAYRYQFAPPRTWGARFTVNW